MLLRRPATVAGAAGDSVVRDSDGLRAPVGGRDGRDGNGMPELKANAIVGDDDDDRELAAAAAARICFPIGLLLPHLLQLGSREPPRGHRLFAVATSSAAAAGSASASASASSLGCICLASLNKRMQSKSVEEQD